MTVNFTAQIDYPLSGLGIDVCLVAKTEDAVRLLKVLESVQNRQNCNFFDFEDLMPDSCIFGAKPQLAKHLIDTVADLDPAIKAHFEIAVQKNVTFSIDSNSHNQGFAVIRLDNEFVDMPEINLCWNTALDLIDLIGLEKPESEDQGREYTAQDLSDAAKPFASSNTHFGRHAANLVRLHEYLQSIGHQNARVYLG